MLEWRETRGAAKDGDVQTQSAAKLLCWYPWSRAISSDRLILPQIPLPPQQVFTSSQQSNAISQGRNTEFTEFRNGKWSPPFHGCISGAPGHFQAEALAETSDAGEQLLPIALHCGGTLLLGEAIRGIPQTER